MIHYFASSAIATLIALLATMTAYTCAIVDLAISDHDKTGWKGTLYEQNLAKNHPSVRTIPSGHWQYQLLLSERTAHLKRTKRIFFARCFSKGPGQHGFCWLQLVFTTCMVP